MDKICLVVFALCAILIPANGTAQTPAPAGVEQYVETGKTIIIGKCISVGPTDIIGRSRDVIDILYVVKGKETLRRITVVSRVSLTEGERYLLRTVNESTPAGNYFKIETRDSAIPLYRFEDLEELKKLSPQIVVYRTMNRRIHALEDEIRERTYEIEALKAARNDN